jgi:hypothetical protein
MADEEEEIEQVHEEEDAETEPFAVSTVLQNQFSQHHEGLSERRKLKRQKLQVKPFFVAEAEAAAAKDGGQGDGDKDPSVASQKKPEAAEFEGDEILAKLQSLLQTIDERGFQRSRQQLMFHDAFIRATSRVMYKKDWSTARPVIMEKNKWTKCSSEILISTPRRFGKTFR